MTRASMIVKPSSLEAFMRGSPWPSSGQWGFACAASARRSCDGDQLHLQAAQLHVRTSAARNANFRAPPSKR
eukprot:10998371-Alexandrium_andersonii.AAC.1